MNRIELLDQNTIDKIAAGEVVERPASVVKELIENSVDSGASAITIEIKNGGIDFLRITDNGCGIPADQVRTAFLRHATSKLRNIRELSGISSLGFRGEALSSISAVSQVELITRSQDSITGVRYIIDGGIEKSFEEIGAPFGTTFLMRHLFFNTPARAKFLKTPASETNAVSSYVEQLALSHPEISFKFMVNGNIKLYTSGNGNLKEAVYQIYGKDAARSLMPVDVKTEYMSINGFLGRPENSRGNRSYEIFFINGRYVRDKIISKAIEDAYHGYLMQHRYPFTVLNFDIDKDKVDVNVHPAKLEVRFSGQEEIYDQIYNALKKVISEHQSIPSMKIDTGLSGGGKTGLLYENTVKDNDKVLEKADVKYNEAFQRNYTGYRDISSKVDTKYDAAPVKNAAERDGIKENIKNLKKVIPEPFEAKRFEERKTVPELVGKKEPVAEKQLSLFEEDRITPSKINRHRIIGQVFDTYFIVEMEDSLYLIDQHAAHEKIMYERLMNSLDTHKIYSQNLMPAIVVSLTLKDAAVLAENMEIFREFGFEIEEFGGREYKITAVPSDLFGIDVKELFIDILDNLNEPSAGEPKLISERIALRACKSAIKANMHMSALESEKLISGLFELEDPYHCPHGRPVMISLSHYELDKKFKRIV